MTKVALHQLVLAIYPSSRGFAFIFFEGPENPVDWGVKDFREKHKSNRSLEEIRKLIDRYRPEVLVIEDVNSRGTRRASRVRKLYRMLAHLASAEYIDIYQCTREEVKACFASVGATTKHEIAKALATQIPALAHRMPRLRKPWMTEDPRQGLFDAAALGIAYYSKHIQSPYLDGILTQ